MSPLRLAMRTDATPVVPEPVATYTVYVQPDTVLPTPSAIPVSRKISGATIVGLSMIPVVVFLVGLYILFLLWFRKRRAARKQHQASISPPPVPEKDITSYKSSISTRRGSSKVFHMAAFSAPLQVEDNRDAPSSDGREARTFRRDETKVGASGAKAMVAPVKTQRVEEADLDSPIDASSPFRLKRGDTVRRASLGPELARLWPSPPESAWSNLPSTHDRPSRLYANRETSVYQDNSGRRQQ